MRTYCSHSASSCDQTIWSGKISSLKIHLNLSNSFVVSKYHLSHFFRFFFGRIKSTKHWINFSETCVLKLLLQKFRSQSEWNRTRESIPINLVALYAVPNSDMYLKRSNVSCMKIYCVLFASILSLSIFIHLIALATVAGMKFLHFNVATTWKERWDLSTNNAILLMAAIVGKMSALWAVVHVLSLGPAFICLRQAAALKDEKT